MDPRRPSFAWLAAPLVVATIAASLGCGGAATPPSAPSAPAPAVAPTAPAAAAPERADGAQAQASLRALISAVAKARGLEERSPIATQLLADDAFRAAVDAGHRGDGDRLAAFYDEETKTIVVRATALPSRRADVAREIAHALQDQHFDLAKLALIDEPDARLAARALVEGDAELVRAAFAPAVSPAPGAPDAPAAPHDDAKCGDADAVAQRGLILREDADDAEAREIAAFPYVAGCSLARALVSAGGRALLDRAFASPPTTTSQVLHPDRYLAGAKAAPVAAVELSSSEYKLAKSDRVGELVTRYLLASEGGPDARALAGAWTGGRMTTYDGVYGKAMVWTSVWESPEAAARVERALRRGGDLAPVFVARDGATVLSVAGVPGEIAARSAPRLFDAVGARPAPEPPPIGR